jgi:hypothetical protein
MEATGQFHVPAALLQAAMKGGWIKPGAATDAVQSEDSVPLPGKEPRTTILQPSCLSPSVCLSVYLYTII